jgi:hypothetical protein
MKDLEIDLILFRDFLRRLKKGQGTKVLGKGLDSVAEEEIDSLDKRFGQWLN